VELTRVEDVDQYFAAPAGKVLHRRSFFCSSPGGDLYTLWAWGVLDVPDTRELFEVLEAVTRHPGPKRRQLVVLRHVEHVTLTSMQLFTEGLSTFHRYRGTIAREAVVRPAGVVGVIAAGFYEVMPQPFEGRVFTEVPQALDWLEPRVEWRAWLDAAVAFEEASRTAHAQEIALLPALFAKHGTRLTLSEGARRLGLSPRTLQRRLTEAGTSFEAERQRAALARAQELLVAGAADVKAIAWEVGFRSPSAFIEMFRRGTSLTPREWQRQHRARS
jgi:AraC-like DNA-binding protein